MIWRDIVGGKKEEQEIDKGMREIIKHQPVHLIAQSVHRESLKVAANQSFAAYSKERMTEYAKSVSQFRKVTVLVSPLTHSAATMAALVLKNRRDATIVGYLSGGSTKTSCFASAGTYSLPVSGVKAAIPETCFKRAPIKGYKDNRLVPDIAIDPLGQNSYNMLRAIMQAGVDHVMGKNNTN